MEKLSKKITISKKTYNKSNKIIKEKLIRIDKAAERRNLFFTITGLFSIPGNVIDIVTLGEKTKAAIKRKQGSKNANIQL